MKVEVKTKLEKLEGINEEITKCHKCRLSETRTNAICGEGNPNPKFMLIGQAPGEVEDKEGRMFIGPSGKVLDNLIKASGLARDALYMTNLLKCMLPGYRKPKQDEIKACSPYLEREIRIVNPEVLVPLGHYATRYILDKYFVPLPMPPEHEFKEVYGKLFLAGGRKILPLQHPAALLYDPGMEGEMRRNYHKLAVLSRPCEYYPVCPIRNFYEDGKLDRKWIDMYCKGDWESCVRYQMQNKGEPHPDWILPDGSISEELRANPSD